MRPRRKQRVGSLADLLPIGLVEPDGLIMTTDGRYVRILECDRVPNTITADESRLGEIERSFSHLCRVIPDHQSLVILAQTDPVPIDDALAPDVRATELAAFADRAAGNDELAQARLRLMAATKRTVREAAGAAQPAVSARWWVVVPYEPVIEDPKERLRAGLAQSRGQRLWETHRDAATESLRLTDQIDGVLHQAGIETWRLDGTQALAVLWDRLHPAADQDPDFDEFAAACQLAEATTMAEASAQRHRILEAICAGPDAQLNTGESPSYLRHQDGTLEEIIHLATPPEATDPSWLAHLLACPLPVTLAVHIRVGNRETERIRQRRRWSRLRSSIRYKERRDRLVGSDEEEALFEAEAVDQEIRGQVGASVYTVGIYASIRDPSGDAETFARIVKQTCSEFHNTTNAKVVRGRYLALQGFASTLPLGIDRLKATRRYAQRNIAHCVPLTSSRCGCPDGLVLGTADPGGTLERLNPFDKVFKTSLTLIVGHGGAGKTVTALLLALRFIAQGGRLFVIDRSSTPDETGNTAGTGHYDMLASLIPGARRVQLGTAHAEVICPWDVADPDKVPDQKIEFLLAFHALLIGEAHDQEGLVRTLNSDEEALLRDAITRVYATAAAEAIRPREQHLLDILLARFESGELAGANADRLQSLLLRLSQFGTNGKLAHLADTATSVDPDSPLVLFDFTGLADRMAPALTLLVADYVEWEIHRSARRRVTGQLKRSGPFAGKAGLIIEEGWKPMASPAAGAWLNEYARRARHYALWLIFVTQFFKDFNSEQGRALLSNYAIALCCQNERQDLVSAKDTLRLSETDIAEIINLPRQKGVFSTTYMVSERGRGAVRIAPGAAEYWAASSDPDMDQPLRFRALAQAGGDPWKALTLLINPAWQLEQAHVLEETEA